MPFGYLNSKFISTKKIHFKSKDEFSLEELQTMALKIEIQNNYDFIDKPLTHRPGFHNVKTTVSSKLESPLSIEPIIQIQSETHHLVECDDYIFKQPIQDLYIKIMLDIEKISIANNFGMLAAILEDRFNLDRLDLGIPDDVILEVFIRKSADKFGNN